MYPDYRKEFSLAQSDPFCDLGENGFEEVYCWNAIKEKDVKKRRFRFLFVTHVGFKCKQ